MAAYGECPLAEVQLYVKGATSWFVHLEKFSLKCSRSLFAIRVNLRHP